MDCLVIIGGIPYIIAMFIQTETTPNPQTLKFIPGTNVIPGGTAFYTSPESAKTRRWRWHCLRSTA